MGFFMFIGILVLRVFWDVSFDGEFLVLFGLGVFG